MAARQNWVFLLKDAATVAAAGFVLLLPLIAFRSEVSVSGASLMLEQRWGLLFALAGAVFAVRLFYTSLANLFSGRDKERVVDGFERTAAYTPYLVPVLLALLCFLPLLPGVSRYQIDLAILILTYVILGWGLNIMVGFAGLLVLGYAGFYAIGAYAYALMAKSAVIEQFFAQAVAPDFWSLWGFWICVPFAGLAAALAGFLLGLPVLRLRGDYLAIVTLAFGEIIRLVLINWVDVTQGSAGISGVMRPSFFGYAFTADEMGFAARFGLDYSSLHRMIFLFYIVLGFAALTYFVTRKLHHLPVGRAWKALREDEIACRALGINIVSVKLTALSIGAFVGGIAGALFATRQGFVSPESFTFMESAVVLAIVVLAGSSELGILFAASLMIGGVEMLRNLGFLKSIFGPDFEPTHYRLLIFGLAMVIVMIWRPRGLFPDLTPTAVLPQKDQLR